MPRNRRKHQANGNSHHNNESEDELSNDNVSVYSYQSENANDAFNNNNDTDGGQVESGGSVGGTGFEKYEEKLLQAIENASDKSLQTRLNAFQVINEILVHHYIPEFIDDRKLTIMDAIEKSIKKGKGAEQACAARIIPLLVIQLEGAEDMNELINVLKPVLLATAQDTAASYDARAKCCMALGLLNFLGSDDIGDLLPLMKAFEGIFSGSYLKGDNTLSSATAEAAALHSSALSAWALLLTQVPSGDLVSLVNSNNAMMPSIKKLTGMLQSPHLDVRMAAGETIALILESGRSHDEDFLETELSDLIEAAQKLATDAHKYRAKRDRKVQRATFRDVLRYLEEDISPEISIKFGKETLLLDTWSVHHQYICLRNALGFGMNVHLAENGFLRDVLQLGAKMDEIERSLKMAKAEKKFINAAAFKARTITRGKNRDKRSAVIN